ncbi:MAG: hemolysin III family protein [Clostridia bacterium]|nr:hemolysin III family protein [Clostridia bacterium]
MIKRTPLKDRVLPDYTRGEEIFNMVTHIVGGGLGIIYLVMCVAMAAVHNNPIGIVSSVIYAFTVITLFTMSSVYHGLKNETAKKVLQVIDHCTIYFMIAGTYTPFALCSVRGQNTAAGWTLFGIIWAVTFIAATFTAIDHNRFKVLGMVCYLAMGWCIVGFWDLTYAALGAKGAAYLISGGILYTVGSVLYMLGPKKRYIHSLFHIFVDLASLMHFFCIFFYVL